MRKAIIGTSVAVLIFGGMSAKAQTPKSPELKVLDRFVGSWRTELAVRWANGDLDEPIGALVTKCKWSLQGHYIESRLTDSDGKQISLSLYTYDSDAGVYKMWTFRWNSPKLFLITLRWNESKKTFTGKGDLGNGITVQTIRFIGNDRYEMPGTIKDASGKVLATAEAKFFRKKKSKS